MLLFLVVMAVIGMISRKGQVRHRSAARRVQGRAADDWGLFRVEVKVNRAPYRKAVGLERWRFRARLKPGRNQVRVRSVDDVGQLSPVARQRILRSGA